MDDIPEALRDTATSKTRSRFKLPPWAWGLLGLAIALFLAGAVSWLRPAAESAQTRTVQPGLRSALVTRGGEIPGSVLGHLPYEEAPADTLRPVVADGSIKLRQAAAESLLDLIAAARADDVIIVPISGFRSVDDQERVFFGIKTQQAESSSERAEVSAPPGYSEHHTGYAIDIADADQPETELEVSFENTAAFRWMQKNAARYNFELSFPRDNPGKVSYEPWHWRFVGDRHSLETFFKARQ
jgi:zinc D-Ala-D-Ala carboxypeptidase